MTHLSESGAGGLMTYEQHIERLHAAVTSAVAAERERCAKLAESFMWFEQDNCSPDEGNVFIARRIRAA